MFFCQIAEVHPPRHVYLLGCPRTRRALIVDPLRDVDRYLERVAAQGLEMAAVALTRVPDRYLSGAPALARRGAQVLVAASARDALAWASDDRTVSLADGDAWRLGDLELRALETPGPTPEHLSFLVFDRRAVHDLPIGLLCGDLLRGSAVGLPAGGDAEQAAAAGHDLRRSLDRVLDLPAHVQLWSGRRDPERPGLPVSTVGYERQANEAVRYARLGGDVLSALAPGQPLANRHRARLAALNRTGPPAREAPPQPPELDAARLAALIGRRDLTLLDLRPAGAREARRSGVHRLPLEGVDFLDRAAAALVPGAAALVVVPSARRQEALRALMRIGVDEIRGTISEEVWAAYEEGVPSPAPCG